MSAEEWDQYPPPEGLIMDDEPVEFEDPFVIILGAGEEGRFASVKSPPKWAFMKMAVASRSKDEIKQMDALTKLILAVCAPEDRERLDEYLSDNDDALDKVQDELGKLSKVWGGRNLQEPSNSLPSSPTPQTPQRSTVVSFSRGTVTVEEPSIPENGLASN